MDSSAAVLDALFPPRVDVRERVHAEGHIAPELPGGPARRPGSARVRIDRLVTGLAALQELDIIPLVALAPGRGAVTADARIRLGTPPIFNG